MRSAIPESKWRWFGHAGHLIVWESCHFHLCTQVGTFLISTIGDYYPMGRDGTRGKRETIGAGEDSFFETYVFHAGKPCDDAECGGCGRPDNGGGEIDGTRSGTAAEAARQHMAYCRKYAATPSRARARPQPAARGRTAARRSKGGGRV